MFNIIAIALSFFVILFLPGWAVFVRFLLPVDKEKSRTLVEDVFFIVFTSFLITTVIGISLALLGAFHFSIIFLLNILFSLILILTKSDLKFFVNFFNFHIPWQDVILLNILLIAAFVYLSPAEDIFGGMDNGIYVNTGVNLVKEGKVVFLDPVMQKIPENLQSSVTSVFKIDDYGLFFSGEDNKELVGQFLPGFPIWIAISYSLLGLQSFLVITPLIALLGLVAVYMFGSAVFNKTAGLIGAFLLSINILYIWFARQALSEIMANLLIFGGACYLSRFFSEKKEVFAQISGLAFGTALLVRFDSALLIIPLLIAFLYYKYKGLDAKGRFQTFWLFSGFIVLTAIASFIYYKNYFKGLILYFLDLNLFKLNGKIGTDQLKIEHILLLAISVFFIFLLIFLYRKSDKIKAKAARLKIKKEHILMMFSGLLTSVLIFEEFIRPALPFRFMSPQANSLKRLGWYLLPLRSMKIENQPVYNTEFGYFAVILTVFFCICLIFTFIKIKSFSQVFAFLIFFTFSVVYFNDLMIVPNHFWLNRRFISVILPFAFICTGYALSELIKKNLYTRILSIILLAVISLSFLDGALMIAQHRELGRSIAQVESIANGMKDDELYIMDSKPEYQYHLLSLPLKYIFGRNVVLFENNLANQRKLASLIPKLRDVYSDIYFCSEKWQNFSKSKMFLTQRNWYELLVRRFEHTTNIDYRPPSKIQDMRITFLSYKIENRLKQSSGSRFLNIGTNNETFLADGFYNTEDWSGVNIRWTMNRFSLFIPGPKDYNTLVITMASGRPPNELPPLAQFFINGLKVGDFYVLQGFQEYKVNIPDWLLEQLKSSRYFLLEGTSETWMPKKSGVNKDVRELGIAIDSIKLIEEIRKDEKPL